MQKIKTEDFQKELQAIDPRIMIVPNQNRPGASNIMLNGVDICPWVSSFELQDEHTSDYVYKLNDMPIPFKTTTEIKEIVLMTLNKLKDPEFSDVLFDKPLNVADETYGEHKA
jgi:hypothetical protein